jgi:hypothetical protein
MITLKSRFLVATLLLVLPAQRAGAQAPGDSFVSLVISDAYVASKIGLFDSIAGQGIFDIPFAYGPSDVEAVLRSAIVYETAAFPLGSSSGAFTYSYDSTSGVAVRSSPSFGPAFAERALTGGRGKFNVGMTYLHRSFSQLEGRDLQDGSLKFYAPLVVTGTTSAVDVVESTVTMSVTSDTAVFFATYGVTNKLDLSVVVPVQSVSINATVSSQLLRFGPPSGLPNPIPAVEASRSGSSSGIGDMAVRAKYNIISAPNAAIAAGVDVRLPTGDEYDLLGTGRFRTRVYAALSSQSSKFIPHANFGYTFNSEANDDDLFFFGPEVSYAAGAEYVAHPRVTILGDFLGRSLADEGRLQEQTTTYELFTAGSSPSIPLTVSELAYEPGLRLTTMLLSIGAKFNPGRTFVVSGHLLFPMSAAGFKSQPTPVFGIDYSF